MLSLGEARQQMEKAIEALRREFSAVRTGKASPALLDTVRVEAYGNPTPINQVASVSAPEPRLLVVQPWDRGLMQAVERAIRESDLGLNPSNDGNVIRVVFPELTEERRKDFIKLAKHAAEDGRVAVRNVRRSARDAMQKMENEGEVGADEHDRYAKQLEELTARHVAQIDKALDQKEQELLEV
jgi:ribosome recycling factor